MRLTCIVAGVLRLVMAFVSCAFRYIAPCVSREYPASSLRCRSYFCREFSNVFAYLLQRRFPLAFRHLFLYAYFACILFASLLFPLRFSIRNPMRSPRFHGEVSPTSPVYLPWVPLCVFPLVAPRVSCQFPITFPVHLLWGSLKSFLSDTPCIRCANCAINLGSPCVPHAFPVRSPCVPRVFPRVFSTCSLMFSNGFLDGFPDGPCNIQ